MNRPSSPSSAEVAAVVRHCLQHGGQVEIDGLGLFRPSARGRFEFVSEACPRVFIAYVQEDAAAAARLYADLLSHGYAPWMDRKKLLPGQNWPRAIDEAIDVSDFFVACFSRRAVGKRGWFQSELRYALDCARRLPPEEIFLIPVRLEECRVPARISREVQFVDLFPAWEQGFRRILAAMRRSRKRPSPAGTSGA
ncbi:MAG: TIR domain-containing protein [Acidobacteria bacterium]|nr:TIR domain-containing protein [Acidobacteriota bacterium]